MILSQQLRRSSCFCVSLQSGYEENQAIVKSNKTQQTSTCWIVSACTEKQEENTGITFNFEWF